MSLLGWKRWRILINSKKYKQERCVCVYFVDETFVIFNLMFRLKNTQTTLIQVIELHFPVNVQKFLDTTAALRL